MIKDIVKDVEQLSKKCTTVSKKTKVDDVIQDLKDTAAAYEESKGCVGLAANQIGYFHRVILCKLGDRWTIMVNPVIAKKSTSWHISEEGCLSFDGIQKVKRWNEIMVVYKDERGKMQSIFVRGFSAAIVQHEIDHLNGVIEAGEVQPDEEESNQ